MRVLAVDTTSERGSLAVVEGEGILAELRVCSSRGHSTRLLPGIEFLLTSLGLGPADLDAYAVARGPGSFTALRVGISTVQGLALGSGRPCVGLSALDVLAARIAGSADTLVAVMNAYRGDVYAAFYDRDARPRGPAVLASPAEIVLRSPSGAAFVGDAVAMHRDAILAGVAGARLENRSLFLAGTLGLLAVPLVESGQGGPADGLRPLYIRDADVRRPPA